MEKNSQDFSMEKAMRMAKSPVGQQLMALLEQTNSAQVHQAASLASRGDIQGAGQLLNALLSNPEAKKLLEELKNG